MCISFHKLIIQKSSVIYIYKPVYISDLKTVIKDVSNIVVPIDTPETDFRTNTDRSLVEKHAL